MYLCNVIYNKYTVFIKKIKYFYIILYVLLYTFCTPSESKKTKKYKEKYKKTLNERYGVDNISELSFVKEKKIKTMLKNYNRVNNFSDYAIKEKAKNNIDYVKVWDKIKETFKTKYGVDKITDIDGVREKISNKQSFNYRFLLNDDEKEMVKLKLKSARLKIKYHRVSKLELKIQEILNELNISYCSNINIDGYNFDILFNNKNILEINGDYWHANPKIYLDTDIIVYPNNNLLKACEVWERDKIKKDKVEMGGYLVNYLWESEIKSMSKSELLNFLINLNK
jgi:G:T-mismatch repair DNA endonuclease (very short patch repair protein)